MEEGNALILKWATILTPALIGGLAFFLQRYITKRDEFEKEMREELKTDRDRTQILTVKMIDNAQTIHSDVISMQKTAIELQAQINEVKSLSERYFRHLAKTSAKLDICIKRVEDMHKNDELHSSAIRGTLEAMKVLKQRLDETQEQMKTVIKQITPELFRVSETKPKKG